jgi:hypothetical protein
VLLLTEIHVLTVRTLADGSTGVVDCCAPAD